MASADASGPLGGHVEIDETLVGGKQRGAGRGTGTRKGKTIVMGMLERDGLIRTGVISDARGITLERAIERNVEPGSTISTDEWRGYHGLQVSPYSHGTVNHSAKQYVSGIHHTNTIEGHWAQIKRSISGTNVHVSSKHLWKYLCEFSYRRNMRASHRAMFDRLVASFWRPRLAEN